MKRFLKSEGVVLFVPLIALILLFASVIQYTSDTASPYLRGDNWRFVRDMLMLYYRDGFSLELLWNDPVHPSPIRAMWLIVNSNLFNLRDMRYDAYLGITFLFGLSVLVIWKFVYKNCFDLGKIERVVLGVLLAFLLMSFSGFKNYEFPLLTMGYIDFFLAILLVVAYEHFFTCKQLKVTLFVVLVLCHVSVLVLSIHLALIFTIAILMVLMLPVFFGSLSLLKERTLFSMGHIKEKFTADLFMRNAVILSGCAIISVIVSSFILKGLGGWMNGRNDYLYVLSFLFDHVSQFVKTVGVGLFFGFLDVRVFGSIDEFEPFLSIVGYSLVIYSLFVLFLYLKNKKYQKSLFSLVIFLASILFMLVVLQNRRMYHYVDEFGYIAILWDRYFKWFQFGFIGLALMSYSLFFDFAKNKVWLLRLGLISTLCVYVLFWGMTYGKRCRKIDYFARYNRNVTALILTEDVSLIKKCFPIRNAKTLTLEFLKENQLNVFCESYPWREVQLTKRQLAIQKKRAEMRMNKTIQGGTKKSKDVEE